MDESASTKPPSMTTPSLDIPTTEIPPNDTSTADDHDAPAKRITGSGNSRTGEYILVTGGLGYIGSHTSLELLKAGYNVIIIDDLSTSKPHVLERIQLLLKEKYSATPTAIPKLLFHELDYRKTLALRNILDEYTIPVTPSGRQSKIGGVIHLAAVNDVAQSVRTPLSYYSNNVAGLIAFLETLNEYGIKTLVFNSSATVYGTTTRNTPLIEEFCVHEADMYSRKGQAVHVQQGCTGITTPYGRTNWMSEAILSDLCTSDPEWKIVVLRTFNPAGYDETGLAEYSHEASNNLISQICRILRGEVPHLDIFASDYDTVDKTAVRDYIHIADVARGFLSAISAATEGISASGEETLATRFRTFNIGSEVGTSVLGVVKKMAELSGREIPVVFGSRRKGDVSVSIADSSRAERELDWKAEHGLDDICRGMWNFVVKNPRGVEMRNDRGGIWDR